MARRNRVTVPDGIYHVTARIAHRAMLLMDGRMKERVCGWIRDVARFSGVEVYSYCVMDNHLHLLVHVPRVPERYWLAPGEEPPAYAFGMRPPEIQVPVWTPGDSPRATAPSPASGDSPASSAHGDCPQASRPPVGFTLPDGEMAERLAFLRGPRAAKSAAERWRRLRALGCGRAADEEKERLCRRMYNLSQFVKTLSERIAVRYNEETGHSGCLWQGRFYSGLVEDSAAVLAVVAGYIDYNPVKAGIASSPSAWRWGSFGLACTDRGADGEAARAMYSRMLGVPWPEARRRMEAVFADELPDGLDERTLAGLVEKEPRDGGHASARSRGSTGEDCRRSPEVRASQTIRTRLWIFRSGAYIGRTAAFGERIMSMLPALFPRPGFRSLRVCRALAWELPRAA